HSARIGIDRGTTAGSAIQGTISSTAGIAVSADHVRFSRSLRLHVCRIVAHLGFLGAAGGARVHVGCDRLDPEALVFALHSKSTFGNGPVAVPSVRILVAWSGTRSRAVPGMRH